ncbi:MAG: PAS domain S-box protein [Deltaproteobacteria bacterium]
MKKGPEWHQFLSSAIEQSSEGIAIAGLDSKLMYVNPAWARMHGYDSGTELIGRSLEVFHNQEQIEQDVKPFNLVVIEKGENHGEVGHTRKDGTPFPTMMTTTLLKNAEGEPVAILGIAQDITERKLAEENLRLNEKRFRDIMNKMADAIFISDLNGNIIDVNRQACDSLGYSREELLRLTVSDVDPQFSMKDHPKTIWAQLPPDGTVTIESKHQRKDGSVFPVEIKIGITELIENPAILGVARDITERKQAEDQIHILGGLVDIAPASIMIHNLDGNILYANQHAFDMHGYSKEEFLALNLRDLDVPESAALIEKRMQQIKEKGAATFDVFHFRKDGSRFPLQIFVKMARWGEKTVLFSIGTDITERHLLEAERLKSQKLEAIGTLAGGIAHDFNNLLQGVFGYISMAKLTANQPEKVIKMLDQAEKALSLSVNLTTQLLTFAKGGNPVKERVDLNPVIENATKFALSGSLCDFRMHLEPDLWPTDVDVGQISQVIQNIVLNASEAMPEGGIIDLSTENISLPQGKRQIKITIKDTGIGIPESYREKIFDPYFTTKQKGSGLGLATSYSIVKNHGGSIRVESEQNQGTTFLITLPASAPEIQEKSPLQTSSKDQRQRRRILLMDDEVMVREVAKNMVEAKGHDIELACHGEEAIGKYQGALLSGTPFDLVILDLTIKGGMGGLETIKKLLEIDPQVKAVVSSGYSDSKVVSKYPDFGFKGLLKKPYTVKTLKECLDGLL